MLSHALQPSFGGGCNAPRPVLVLSKGSCSSGLNCAHGGGPASPSVRRQLVQCWLDQHAAADTGEVDGSVRPGTDLQASIGRLVTAGGGTLRLGPGRFELRRPLVLRSGVSIVRSADVYAAQAVRKLAVMRVNSLCCIDTGRASIFSRRFIHSKSNFKLQSRSSSVR